jgi:hypothetical protein
MSSFSQIRLVAKSKGLLSGDVRRKLRVGKLCAERGGVHSHVFRDQEAELEVETEQFVKEYAFCSSVLSLYC